MLDFVKSIILSTAVVHVCVESITKVCKHTKTYFEVWLVPIPFNTYVNIIMTGRAFGDRRENLTSTMSDLHFTHVVNVYFHLLYYFRNGML